VTRVAFFADCDLMARIVDGIVFSAKRMAFRIIFDVDRLTGILYVWSVTTTLESLEELS